MKKKPDFEKGIILLGVILLLLLSTCAPDHEKGIYNSGRIEYQITYLNSEKDNYDVAILPKKMVLEFNQNYSINTIEGFMGLFKLSNITYFENKKSETYLKVFGKHYLYSGGRKEMMCCFDYLDKMKIEFDTATKILAGLKSQKATIKTNSETKDYDIYYTHDINLNNPNSTNPYYKVQGVLTDFRLTMGSYEMQFTAREFTPNIRSDSWKLPKNIQKVNREEMFYILDRIMK